MAFLSEGITEEEEDKEDTVLPAVPEEEEDKESTVLGESVEAAEENEDKDSNTQEETTEERDSTAQDASTEVVEEDGDKESADQEEDGMEIDTEGFPEQATDEFPKPEIAASVESENDILNNVEIAPETQESTREATPQIPEQESGMLQRARDGDDYNGTRRLSTFQDEEEFEEYLKTSIHLFATEHPFWTIDAWEENDMAEFESDVQQFAIATGMDEEQADVEVARAMVEWRSTRVMDISFIVSSSPVLTTTITAIASETDKKRKRGESKEIALNSESQRGEDEESVKKRKKEAKNARHKERREQKASVQAAAVLASEQKGSMYTKEKEKASIEFAAIPELQVDPAGGDDEENAKKLRKEAKKARYKERIASAHAAAALAGKNKKPAEVKKQEKFPTGNNNHEEQSKAPGRKDGEGKEKKQKAKRQDVKEKKPKVVQEIDIEIPITEALAIEQASTDEAIAEARKQRNIAKKLRRQQERLLNQILGVGPTESELAEQEQMRHAKEDEKEQNKLVKEEAKEQKRLSKMAKRQQRREAEEKGNEKLNLQSSDEWYGAAPSNNASAAAAKTSEQTPVTGPTEGASAGQPLAKKKKNDRRNKNLTNEQSKAAAELKDKVDAAKSAVSNAVDTAPSEADNRKAAEGKRKKKRNKNKLPEEKIVKPDAPVNQKPQATQADSTDAGTSLKRQKKRKEAADKRGDKPLIKEDDSSAQLEVKVTVQAEKPVSKKRSRDEAEASEAIEPSATDVATKSDEPRKKRQRTRKSRAEQLLEKAVTGLLAVEVVLKSEQVDTPMADAAEASGPIEVRTADEPRQKRQRTRKPKTEQPLEKTVTELPAAEVVKSEQEDTSMADATEALAEIVDPNVKRKRVRKNRKSIETKDLGPDSEQVKVHHL